MTRLRVTFAGVDYWDRTRPLMDGTVQPAGVDLNYIVVTLKDLFRRVARFDEFDAAEMSLSTLSALVARGDRRFVALPVFPSRNFRHSYLFLNTNAAIREPGDLRGRRVGVPEYQMTAALWLRAILQHDHGVHPREMLWFTGGLDTPGYVERAPLELPADIRLQRIPEHRHLEEMLETGDLDALISPIRPRALVAGAPHIRRLFPDYRRTEADWYRRTGMFPIMHTVVIRRAVYEANPWLAMSLYDAFERARRLARERLASTGALAVALPWLPADLEEIDEVFAGRDPWQYGLDDHNRRVIEAVARYSVEQGLAPRPVTIEELFAPETMVPPTVGDPA